MENILTANDFIEETYWVWQCKKCTHYNDEFRHPEEELYYVCDHCGIEFMIVG